jgi:hypothetical protein
VEDISVVRLTTKAGLKTRLYDAYDTTTAVPLIVTINMLALVPTVSRSRGRDAD